METTPLLPILAVDPVAELDDQALIALFADGGLTVEVAEVCGDASCPECFRPAPARAA